MTTKNVANTQLSATQLEQLRRLDSGSISNAIETFDVRLRNVGFTDSHVRCVFPDFPNIIGYAATARVRTLAPPMEGHSYYDRTDWWNHILSLPAPRIVVVQDVDEEPGLGAFVGEVHASILRALGCVGVVTNGAVRGLNVVRSMRLQMFAGNISVSHAYAHVFDFGRTVTVGKMNVAPGDLVHGDLYGAQTIPLEIADRVAGVAEQICAQKRRCGGALPVRGFQSRQDSGGNKGLETMKFLNTLFFRTATFFGNASRVISFGGESVKILSFPQQYKCRPVKDWMLLAMAVLAAGVSGGCGQTNKVNAAPRPVVAVVKVARHSLANRMEVASEFRPYQEIEVYAKVSGYIQKLDVDWGSHVKKGQLMAVLEVPELEEQLQQDDASVHRSEHDLERAQEDQKRAESAYNVAHLGYSRLAEVQKTQPGLVAQQDIDDSQGKDLEASASMAAAKDSIASAEQALLASKAALEKDKALFAYTSITAPFDGVVTEVHAYTGALLPAGTSSNIGSSALCHLQQNNLLRLVIPVPEQAVPDVRVGQMVDVKVSALNSTFRGKIVLFSGQIDMETRTMHTEVDVPNPNFVLVPGMYASVEIPLHQAPNVLAVPVQALQPTTEGHGTVLVVDATDKIEKRNVTEGLQTANDVEISSGLEEGERVVIGDPGQYQEGEAVTPKDVDASLPQAPQSDTETPVQTPAQTSPGSPAEQH